MMVRTTICSAILFCFVALASGATVPATQPSTQPAIDPVADQILQQSCEYLAKTPAFSVHAEIWKDEVLPSGHKIQVTRTVALDFSRPDRLHVDARAHHKGRSIWYDGKTVTVLDRENNLYGTVDAPHTVDETLDLLSNKFGITVPLEDLVVADPYASSMKNVTAGGYFGDEPVLGVSCRHIGFSTAVIDWQLWIADSPQPLPQKLVITYKTEEQSPQYTAIFAKWELLDRASDLPFKFIPPKGSSAIPLTARREQGHP
jgi:hypothetical protein